MKTSLLIEYRGTTLDELETLVCHDCDRDFGVRHARVVRALSEDGQPVTYTICAKCARKEARENSSGMRQWPRRIYRVGMLLVALSVVCIPGVLVELALWGFHVIGQPVVGWYWLVAIPAFVIGVTLSGASATYSPWRNK